MVELNKRLSLISKIVEQKPFLGKTAMMKIIYILQQVYSVPLGYDYEIYTYGPYCSEVMEDIQLAADFKAIRINSVVFPNGNLGYELREGDNIKNIIDMEKDFVYSYGDSILEVIKIFGNKTAKELELSSTIIYMYINYTYNNWDNSIEKVSEGVKKIKPHFDIETIKEEYNNLNRLGMFNVS